jgi:hypothetical protein
LLVDPLPHKSGFGLILPAATSAVRLNQALLLEKGRPCTEAAELTFKFALPACLLDNAFLNHSNNLSLLSHKLLHLENHPTMSSQPLLQSSQGNYYIPDKPRFHHPHPSV